MSTQREILKNLTKANSPNHSSNKNQTSSLNFWFPRSIKPRNNLEFMKNIFFIIITISPRLPDSFQRIKVGIFFFFFFAWRGILNKKKQSTLKTKIKNKKSNLQSGHHFMPPSMGPNGWDKQRAVIWWIKYQAQKQPIHLLSSGKVKESVKEPKQSRYENRIKLRKTTIWTLKSMPINKLKSRQSTENRAEK